MKVLFVCLGNICRSPIAEGVLRHMTEKNGLDWEIYSAGTYHYHIGKPPHNMSQQVCKANGIDISRQKARLFQKEDLNRYDKIYAMAADVLDEMKIMTDRQQLPGHVTLFLNELEPGSDRDMPDPYYGTATDFNKVMELSLETCSRIIDTYKNEKKL